MNTAFIYKDRPQEPSIFPITSASNNDEQAQVEVLKTFLAAVAHELHTPLSGLIITCSIARQAGCIDKDKHLDVIQNIGSETLRILDNMLSTIKAQKGMLQVTIQKRTFELKSWLERTLVPVHHYAALYGKTVLINFTPSTQNISLHTDMVKLGQVLHNLLSNAIKYSSENSEIIVFCTTEGNNICFEVSSAGTPIPMDKLGSIFEPFNQVGKATIGTGLGLYISKLYIEAMDGQISVVSDNTLTIFRVKIPFCVIP